MIQLTHNTIAQLCIAASQKYGGRLAFALFRENKICPESRVTYRMMGIRALQIGLILRQLGVASGDRVLLFSENCPAWPLSYFGIALAGAVSVPLLTGFSPDQVRHIADHAEVTAIITSRAMAAKTEQLPPSIPKIFIDSMTSQEITVLCEGGEKILALPVLGSNPELPVCKPDDLAAIIYTSGTSGTSKGVMLSHENIIFSAFSSLSMVKLRPYDRLISVLPLAHAYECSLGMLGPVISGSSINYLDRPPSASVLLPAAKAIRPTVMATVPVFIEKMYNNAIAPALERSKLYRSILTRPLVTWIAGRKLGRALGGRIRYFAIGGAPLVPEVEKFLRCVRFPYVIGYGLTEAAPLVAGTSSPRFPFRSAGTAPLGVELRIAAADEDSAQKNIGEIQLRGPNVMMGYYCNEEQTREAFTDDGWLRTGDLGSMDSKGQLYICGRIKSLILGPGGENIYPEEIEGLLGSSQLIEEALVYSGEKGELVALVRLSDAAKAAASALEHILEELKAWANKKLARFSRLSRIEVQHEPFEKTPTMKIKRYLYPRLT